MADYWVPFPFGKGRSTEEKKYAFQLFKPRWSQISTYGALISRVMASTLKLYLPSLQSVAPTILMSSKPQIPIVSRQCQ